MPLRPSASRGRREQPAGPAEPAGQSASDRSVDAEDERNARIAALCAVNAETHPRIAAVGADLVPGSPEQRLAGVVRTMVNGARIAPVTTG